MSFPTDPPTPDLLVVCLCAQWCGTCTEYQPLFTALQSEFAGAKFVWVDVEDQSDLVDPIEVGQDVTFSVVVTNQGSSQDSNVKVAATLPQQPVGGVRAGLAGGDVVGRPAGQRFTGG